MKKLFYIVLLLGSTYVFSQNKGMTYQAVIYAPGGQNVPGVNITNVPLTNRTICLQFSFLDVSSGLEYQEVIKTTTDEFGMVNLTIGSGNQTGGYASSFAAIAWSAVAEKSLKIALDASGLCSQFDELSVQKLEAVPFANAALTSENVSGIVPILHGGTGATTAASARINLGLGNVENTADLNKPMSTATKIYVDSQLVSSSIPDATTTTKGKIQLAGDLAGTAAAPTVPGLGLKENSANKSTTTSLGTSNVLFPTQNAVKTYVDTAIAGATIVDADATTKGKIQLAGDLAGTAAVPTVPGLGLKENAANKSTTTTLGTSNVLFPTQNAVKTYVDTAIAGATIVDADATTKGKLQLAGDLTGTATLPQIATSAVTSAKILDETITTVDLADSSVTDAKINTVSGSKVTGDITGNADNVNGIVAIAKGGTGSSTKIFVDLSTDQTIDGVKIFNSDTYSNGLRIGKGSGNNIQNTTLGYSALSQNTSGEGNTALGFQGLMSTTTGSANTAIGFASSIDNTTGGGNTSVGYQALQKNTGNGNIAIGANTMYLSQNSNNNIAIGGSALISSNGAGDNLVVGVNAAPSVTTASQNVIIGNASGNTITTENNNTIVGYGTNVSAGVTNATALGNGASVATSNTIQLGNNAVTAVNTGGVITANGYVKTGGTASQFLKADGTVDTTTYLSGTIPLTNGGTGATTASDARTNLGLGNVDNTTDANKPVSTATQTALDLKENLANKSTDIAADAASTTKYPSVKVIKEYVDALNAAAGVADGSITSAKIADGTIVNADVSASAAIAYSKLNLVNSIVTADITANAVTTAKITDSNVTYAKIQDVSATDKVLGRVSSGAGVVEEIATTGSGNVVRANSPTLVTPALGTPSAAVLTNATDLPLTTGVTGILPIANGGTGSATKNFVDLTTTQTIAGDKTFSKDIIVNGVKMGLGAGQVATNTAIGNAALNSNTTGSGNTATGGNALVSSTTGVDNTAVGYNALQGNTTGSNNVGIGVVAGANTTTGDYNIAIGKQALQQNTTGSTNIAVGAGAIDTMTSGNYNTVLGGFAGRYAGSGTSTNTTTMNNSILLGYDTRPKLNNDSNEIVIGSGAIGNGSNTTTIGNASNTDTYINGKLNLSSTIKIAGGTPGLGKVLTSDANGLAAWSDIPVSNLITGVTGILPLASGGTGSATQNFVDLTTAQTIAGTKTFSDPIAGSITGNAATVTTNANLTGDVTSSGNATTIGASKVVTGMIADGTIVVADIADNAVETAKIKDANVTTAKLAAAAVTTAKITDANVTYAKIQNVSATDKVLGRVSTGAGVVEEIATTGSGNVVRATSPTLVTPDLGVPSAVDLTNATNLPLSSVTGTLAVANGGTGISSLTTGYIPFGKGTNAFGSSSNLFWDNTNARLGINTTTPSATFQIGTDCSSCADNLKYFVDNGYNTLKLGFRSTGWHMRSSNNSGVATDLLFSYNNGSTITDQLSIGTTGTVTIPGALNVTGVATAGTGNFTDFNLNNTISYSSSTNKIGFFGTPSSQFQIFGDGNFEYPFKYDSDSNGGSLKLGFRNKEFRIKTTSNSGVLENMIYSYYNGATDVESMRIINDGTVRIGNLQILNNAAAGKFLSSDANGVANWSAIPATNLASGVTGVLPVANGGTGSATQNFVDLTTAQTIAGTKTFSSAIAGSITGNAATVTNGVYTTDKISALSATTSAELKGVISDETGSGTLVFATSPTLVTPTLGVASATSVNGLTPTALTTGFTIAGGSTTSKTLTVSGDATVSGTNTGDQTTITGNAGTATKLAATKNINGVAFDGSADITVTAAAGTLTGTTLASNVVSSSLTSVGTLANLTVTNAIAGSITGNAATVTTNANLTGDVTSTGNATTVGKINGTSLAGLATGILKNTTSTGVPSIAVAADFPTLNQNTTGSAATLTTARAIYGNNFDGSASLTGIIASTYGGTGNGFTKFSGPTTSEKTFTLPDSNATLARTDAAQTFTGTQTFSSIIAGSITGNAATVTNGVYTTSKISDLSATTSAELAGKISDETGTGALVFATSPSLVTPTLGVASATSVNKVTITAPTTSATLTIADGKTLTMNNSITLAGTDATTMTFPSTTATIARTDAAQTFSGTQTFSGDVVITSSTSATTTGTGALKVTGGAGIGGAVYAGSIQNTPIGSTTASTAAFTTLSTSGNTTIGGTLGVTGDVTVNTDKFKITASSGNTEIAGTIKVAGGTPGVGKILTSDANGLASWTYGSSSVSKPTATATISISDKYVFYDGTADGTLTLPAATGNAGKEIIIKNRTTKVVTVSRTGTTETIYVDTANSTVTSFTIGSEASNNWVKLVSDGSNWVVFRALF